MVVDTSVLVDFLGNEPSAVRLFHGTVTLFLPAVALGELFYGAEYSDNPEANRAQVEDLTEDFAVLDCDLETARVFGKIKQGLRRRGRLIPDNDIWIAAIARQHRMPLVARDAHFAEVDGLSLVHLPALN